MFLVASITPIHTHPPLRSLTTSPGLSRCLTTTSPSPPHPTQTEPPPKPKHISLFYLLAVWGAWMPDGFSHRLLFERPPKSSLPLTYLTVPFPGGSHESVLGLGDVVFTGLLLGIVERAGLSTKRAVLGVFLGFGGSVYVHLETALLLPSLVYVGPAAALALGRTVKPRWAELAQALAFVTLAWGGGYWIQP